jgi:flagellar capping protein FliD
MRSSKVTNYGTAALTALLMASCAPPYLPPQQVQSSNPNVTYKYNDDNGLVQVNQSATTYCNQYRATPRPANFANNPDGSKSVVFECVQPTMQTGTQTPYNPNLTYNYRTDAELLNASRNAQVYCVNNGSQQVTSNIIANTNGTRTVTFQCSRN